LKKKIYGHVQNTRLFHVKNVKAMKSCGFTGGFVNPFLWVNKANSVIVMMVIYVDDCLTIGSDGGIKEVNEDMKSMTLVLRLKKCLKTIDK
jgi:hypothetical protein